MTALRNLNYKQIETLINIITKQRTLKNYSELAILRLMNAIKTENYAHFYTYLEKNGNKALRYLVKEMHDASIYFWDENNYTNFIGALVTMFRKAPDAIKNRWPDNAEDFAQRVVNLNPIKYDAQPENNISDAIVLSAAKHNEGSYDKASGNIIIKNVYTTTSYDYELKTQKERRETIAVLSPLTPVIIIPESDNLPLIARALEAENGEAENLYVAPAIFLKYQADKAFNDRVKTAGTVRYDPYTFFKTGKQNSQSK